MNASENFRGWNFRDVSVQANYDGIQPDLYTLKFEPFHCAREGCTFEARSHLKFLLHLHTVHYKIPCDKEELELRGMDPRVKEELESVRDARKGRLLKPFLDENSLLLSIPLGHPMDAYVRKGVEFLYNYNAEFPSFKVPSLNKTFSVVDSFLGRWQQQRRERPRMPRVAADAPGDVKDKDESEGEDDEFGIANIPMCLPPRLRRLLHDQSLPLKQRMAILSRPSPLNTPNGDEEQPEGEAEKGEGDAVVKEEMGDDDVIVIE